MMSYPNPPLQDLYRIVYSPVFSQRGGLICQNGYSSESKCYLYYKGKIPEVPKKPNNIEISIALDRIDEFLFDFPFKGRSDRTNAMSLFLTPCVREMINGPVPIYMIEAPSPGTGKTLLAQVLSYPFIGRSLEAMAEGRNDEEMRKRISAKLLNSPAYILIDNVTQKVAYGSLASAVTSGVWEDRRLGVSQIMRLPVKCTWILTGNNPTLSSEIARRCVRIQIDAGREQPWLRNDFKHKDIISWVKKNREDLIWSALVLIQNWISNGKNIPENTTIMGMFEDWSRVMSGILELNGIRGFLKNMDKLYTDSDIETAVWSSFVNIWWETYESGEVSTADLYNILISNDIPIEFGSGSERSQKISLGKQISQMRNRRFGKFCIASARQKNHMQLWRLEFTE